MTPFSLYWYHTTMFLKSSKSSRALACLLSGDEGFNCASTTKEEHLMDQVVRHAAGIQTRTQRQNYTKEEHLMDQVARHAAGIQTRTQIQKYTKFTQTCKHTHIHTHTHSINPSRVHTGGLCHGRVPHRALASCLAPLSTGARHHTPPPLC